MNRTPLLCGLRDNFEAPSLEETILVGRQHLITHTRLMLLALFARGLKPENVHLLGKCYSTNNGVLEELKNDGVHVLPESTFYHPHRPYDEITDEHARDLADFIANQSKEKKRVTILDSGGHLLRAANNHPELVSQNVVGIEQTSSGFNAMADDRMRFPVLNIARCAPKLEVESGWIAESAKQPMIDRLRRMPREFQRHKQDIMMPGWRRTAMRAAGIKPPLFERIKEWKEQYFPPSRILQTLILGGGAIGNAVRNRFLKEATIFDTKILRSDVFPWRLASALSKADVIIGCSGKTSVPQKFHRHLKNQAVLASVSSSDCEFDAVHLRKNLPAETGCHTDSIVEIEATGHRVHLFSQGFPITFSGAAEIVPLEKIQLTAALLMSAVLDAHKYKGEKGIIEYPQHLHPLIQDFLRKQTEESVPNKLP